MRPSAKFGYQLGAVLGLVLLVVFFLPNLESFHTLGPANTGHDGLACQDCHVPAVGTARQQMQANSQYWLGLRASSVDFQHQTVSNSQCLACHVNPKDAHPVHRFHEPRFAEARASIHPERCVSCHREHQGTRVTMEPTFCVQCHQKLTLKNDPIDVSHEGLINLGNWETCLGCHDFHGNHKMTVRQSIKNRLDLATIRQYFEGGPFPIPSRNSILQRRKAMTKPWFLLTVLVLLVLGVYLFVQRPEPLPEEGAVAGETVPIKTVFTLVVAENDIARSLWTREIVGKGKKAGLAFGEDWLEDGVEKGPLPALFLRAAATRLERHHIPLSLFLGSDFPIAPSNLFSGPQMEKFRIIKETHEPQFFYAEDAQLHTAMFADFASVAPCVNCHNAHPDSPKTDWKLNDVMGATTWAYPKAAVSRDEFIAIVKAFRHGITGAYVSYLEKVATFSAPPEIGEQWPREGYYLPSAEVFLQEFA